MEHNSVIGCLNKSYLEGWKNEMELKTSIKKAVVTQLEYFIFFQESCNKPAMEDMGGIKGHTPSVGLLDPL